MKIERSTLPLARQQLGSLKEQKEAFEAKMRNASELYERQFLQEMVKAMRGTVSHSEFSKPSMAQQIYEDKVFDNYVDQWAQNGGVGFAEIIYNQLSEKYSPFHGNHLIKPMGPIPLQNQEQPTFRIKNNEGEQGKQFKIDVSLSSQSHGEDVLTPWDAQVKKLVKNSDNRAWVQLEHSNGITSDLTFRGQILPGLSEGDFIKGGEPMGKLASDENGMHWSLAQPKS